MCFPKCDKSFFINFEILADIIPIGNESTSIQIKIIDILMFYTSNLLFF